VQIHQGVFVFCPWAKVVFPMGNLHFAHGQKEIPPYPDGCSGTDSYLGFGIIPRDGDGGRCVRDAHRARGGRGARDADGEDAPHSPRVSV